MEVRPRAAARGAAQADHLARLDPLPGLDLALRQVAVVSLQAVVVAYDDQVAVAPLVVLRDAHAAAERGVDRIADLARQVDALVLATAAGTVLAVRMRLAHIGTVVAAQRVHQFDHHRSGHGRHIDLLIGKEGRRVPVLLENGAVLGDLAVADVFPGIVAVEHHLHGVVVRGKRVDHRQTVGRQGRFDVFALKTQPELRDRVGLGLGLRGDRSGRRHGLRSEQPRSYGQRVGQRARRRGGLQGCHGQKRTGEYLTYHVPFSCCSSDRIPPLRAPHRTPRRNGGRWVREAPCRPARPVCGRRHGPERTRPSDGS